MKLKKNQTESITLYDHDQSPLRPLSLRSILSLPSRLLRRSL